MGIELLPKVDSIITLNPEVQSSIKEFLKQNNYQGRIKLYCSSVPNLMSTSAANITDTILGYLGDNEPPQNLDLAGAIVLHNLKRSSRPYATGEIERLEGSNSRSINKKNIEKLSSIDKGVVIFGTVVSRHGLEPKNIKDLSRALANLPPPRVKLSNNDNSREKETTYSKNSDSLSLSLSSSSASSSSSPASQDSNKFHIVIVGAQPDSNYANKLKKVATSVPLIITGPTSSLDIVANCKYAISFDPLGFRDNASAMVNVLRAGHLLFSIENKESPEALIQRAAREISRCESNDDYYIRLLSNQQANYRRLASESIGSSLANIFQNIANNHMSSETVSSTWYSSMQMINSIQQRSDLPIDNIGIATSEEQFTSCLKGITNQPNGDYVICMHINPTSSKFENQNSHWAGLHIRKSMEGFKINYFDPLGGELNHKLGTIITNELRSETLNNSLLSHSHSYSSSSSQHSIDNSINISSPITGMRVQYAIEEHDSDMVSYRNANDCGPILCFLLSESIDNILINLNLEDSRINAEAAIALGQRLRREDIQGSASISGDIGHERELSDSAPFSTLTQQQALSSAKPPSISLESSDVDDQSPNSKPRKFQKLSNRVRSSSSSSSELSHRFIDARNRSQSHSSQTPTHTLSHIIPSSDDVTPNSSHLFFPRSLSSSLPSNIPISSHSQSLIDNSTSTIPRVVPVSIPSGTEAALNQTLERHEILGSSVSSQSSLSGSNSLSASYTPTNSNNKKSSNSR